MGQLQNLLQAYTGAKIKQTDNHAWVGVYLSRVSTAINKEKSLGDQVLDKMLEDVLHHANFTASPNIPMSLLVASQSNGAFRDWFQFLARGK